MLLELYVGGSFSKMAGNTSVVDYLVNVARYNMQAGTWTALNAVSVAAGTTSTCYLC